MLNLLYLRSFVKVVELGSFRGASDWLDLAQPTVSQHVAKLENQLGKTLIHRIRNQSEPTEAGRRLLPFARTLLATASRAVEALERDNVAVSACSNIGVYSLPPVLADFQDTLGDDVEVDLTIGSNLETLKRLENREADVAIMEWWDDRPGFKSFVWRREHLVAICQPGHPLEDLKVVKPRNLEGYGVIGGEAGTGTGRLLDDVFGPEAERLKVDQTLGSTEAVKRAVRVGLGVSFVLESAVKEEVEAGSLVAIPFENENLAKEIRIIWPKDARPDSPAMQLVDFLLQRPSAEPI